MREVRMTFGDHLEELRRRIIFCLLYLAGGVLVCFAFGQDLLQLTIGPHHKAIEAAQRDRLVKRMEGMVGGFLDQISTKPRPGAQRTDDPEEYQWEVLFVQDIVAARMRAELSAPFEEFAEALASALDTLESEARDGLREAALRLGRAQAESFARIVLDFELSRDGGVLKRLEKLAEKLEEIERQFGPSRAQKAIGWGEDLEKVLGPLRRFQRFLENQRDLALSKRINMDELRERVDLSKLPDVLDEDLTAIEKSADDIRLARNQSLMAISYLENFNAYLKVTLIFGILITIPFILYELWKFVGAGLHPHEQKYVVLFLPFSLALFAVGGMFGYFVMIPVGLEFLAGWGLAEVNLSITLNSYVSLFFTLTLILGLVFQTPLVMIFLTKIGVTTTALLRRMRRVSVFVGVCLAVVLTPPDPFSWSLMAAPMIVLYEIGILLSDWLGKPA